MVATLVRLFLLAFSLSSCVRLEERITDLEKRVTRLEASPYRPGGVKEQAKKKSAKLEEKSKTNKKPKPRIKPIKKTKNNSNDSDFDNF